ncbi:hypothetical protein EW146_g64 [Bondarzewia mesenterica]|uniref:CCZ1/INTU/HSP4 first Longin domain-containing protein n=1 Tax=Bondarzewia mesenterica TaxID=1095465 RepID=A0A4S4M838_9AGAM|nr:hypothetical protein EW146_g64 [Bondarzewia mesenterica]
MSRLPPALLYLTIYNPTLKPKGSIPSDDEDAEEQAHILFYTARERAVSRDRILRQVGLAKALIHFSEMFSPEEACENVHSQSRRMIMVSPEPDFWIHACFELAKTPRQAGPGKGKGKGKAKDKGIDRERAKEVDLGYDYQDGSAQDIELRSHLLRGYKEFKLVHGSFSSILNLLGQQALELQLERFFTVWAWKWDVEEDADFGIHLGMPLHPIYPKLVPLVDDFASKTPLSDNSLPFVLAPPHIVPSTSFTTSNCPLTLPLYLRSRIPPPRPSSPPPSVKEQPALSAGNDSEKRAPASNSTKHSSNPSGSSLLSLGATMDVRKWNWPEYLTFGKGGGRKTAGSGDVVEGAQQPEIKSGDAQRLGVEEPQVDAESLHDAMSSVAIPVMDQKEPPGDEIVAFEILPPPAQNEASEVEELSTLPAHAMADHITRINDAPHDTISDDPPINADKLETPSHEADDRQPPPSPPRGEPPSPLNPTLSPILVASPAPSHECISPPSTAPTPAFSSISIYIAALDEPQATVRRRVYYLIRDQLAIAFVARENPEYTDDELSVIHEAASVLLTSIKSCIAEQESRWGGETPLPSTSKILQQRDQYILDTGHGTTVSSPDFASRSEHLYQGQELIGSPEVLEVFSRTQGAQHWHIARREAESETMQFMEVYRKETSLIDVDNELAEVVRQCRGDLHD